VNASISGFYQTISVNAGICQHLLVKLWKKGIVVKPILHNEMNSRCQVDLIDMQSNPDGDMKFI
jgi:hypothetical protein